MSQYIKDLILKGENQQLDFKYCITDSKKIARSLVAFSNTDGGILLIGVKDNGAITGVKSEEEYYMVEAAASMYSKPPVAFTYKTWEINGKTVLEVKIEKSAVKPHYALDNDGKWKVYIRVNDQNLLANRILLRVWKNKAGNKGIYIRYTQNEQKLFEFLDQHHEISLSGFCRIASISRQKASDILIKFITLNIIRMVFTEKGALYQINPDEINTLDEIKEKKHIHVPFH